MCNQRVWSSRRCVSKALLCYRFGHDTKLLSPSLTQIYFSDASPTEKINALKKACERHVVLTKECSKGLGQDRHLYALYCLLQREIVGEKTANANSLKSNSQTSSSSGDRVVAPRSLLKSPNGLPHYRTLSAIFTDPGWSLLSTSILSTSNCGNPALRLFGFGPVAADGYGIGYINKNDGISMCVLSIFFLPSHAFIHLLRNCTLFERRY